MLVCFDTKLILISLISYALFDLGRAKAKITSFLLPSKIRVINPRIEIAEIRVDENSVRRTAD